MELDLQSSSNKPHVAVFAFPFSSHAASLLALTRRLAEAAPNVNFSFFGTAKSNRSVFGSKSNADNLKAYDVEDGVPQGYEFRGKLEEEVELFLKATPLNFKKALEVAITETGEPTEKKISCVMSDAFLWVAGELAEELGVPWVSCWIGGAYSLSTHFYTDLIRSTISVGLNGIAGLEEKTLDFIPGLSTARVGDLQEGILIGNLESPFSKILHQMGRMLPRAAAVTINSYEELDPTIINHLDTKFLTLGPFSLLAPPPSGPDDTGCVSWLDGRSSCSVVYVSFGTVTAPGPDELTALAEGIEESGAPFLWSLKEGLKGQLPDGFLERTRERGRVIPWVPQSRVLKHSTIGAFVTHGGWNSVLEAITGGVPMICRPYFGDQRLNVRMISDVWGIGVTTKGGAFTKEGLLKALDSIFSSAEGKKMRERVRVLKEKAEKAMGPSGSSSDNFNSLLEIVGRA